MGDHPLLPSGVGTQSRYVFEALLDTGKFEILSLGGAIKHPSYEPQRTEKYQDSWTIMPVNGYGDAQTLRGHVLSFKPDIIWFMTDPRFYEWLWHMEDELRENCSLVYYHVWDNYPRPDFNDKYYESTDLINCHSHITYEMVKEKWPERTNFIPHALPEDVFCKISPSQKASARRQLLGDKRKDDFVLLWVNRNAKRKRPSDLLWSFKQFLDGIEKVGDRKPATLVMHTDPFDQEGPDLVEISKLYDLEDNLIFSNQRVGFDEMNLLHNCADCYINISYAEGFGLGTLEAMQTGTPIVAAKTGGLTRQVVDHRDGSENGAAVDIALRSLVGSQQVPYIYEDYVDNEDVAAGITKIYKMTPDEREKLSQKVIDYVDSEFNFQNTIDMWDETLKDMLENWKDKYNRVVCEEIK